MSCGDFSFSTVDDISAIDAGTWDRLNRNQYPFTQHAFLSALESSSSVGADSGWSPLHVIVRNENWELCAAMPMYVKDHSYGEYVFDWSWADAYRRYGQNYYPKLLAAIPFTPAQGPRLLHNADVKSEILIPAISSYLRSLCEEQGYSSAHILFPEQDVSGSLAAEGFLQRTGTQFHWFNRDYRNFDDFLERFTSRKRKSLRRERRKVAEQGVSVLRLRGDEARAEDWSRFYFFYQLTYAKRSGHGGYLSEAFFHQISRTLGEQLLLIFAYRGEQCIAGALCFFDQHSLYGRYWGALETIDGLHFECCYYQGIEFCIEQGLRRFDPGAQGEHKIQRGFEPCETYSNHWIEASEFQAAISDFLQREKQHNRLYKESCHDYLPFKQEE